MVAGFIAAAALLMALLWRGDSLAGVAALTVGPACHLSSRDFKEKIMQLGVGKLTKESAPSKKPKEPKEPTTKAPEFILSGPMVEKIKGMNEGDVFVANLLANGSPPQSTCSRRC
jgi:hypothetical protein